VGDGVASANVNGKVRWIAAFMGTASQPNERYSGVKLAEAFAIPDLDREVKWHSKYARQNGIHVSPTFMVDGLVQADMSSGDPVTDWVSRLLKH